MIFKEEQIQALFSRKDFPRGQEYCKRNQVQDLKVSRAENGAEITCTVQGSEPCEASIYVNGQSISGYCPCPQFKDKNICKHVAAVMLACAELREEDLPAESDCWAKSMLRTYMDKSAWVRHCR